jgi:hypothetical protein
VNPADVGATTAVITGFGKDIYGKGPMYDIGPLGLVFVDGGKTLVVGGGDKVDGQEIMRAFSVPEGDKTLTAEDVAWSAGPIAAGDQSTTGEGNFYGLAAHGNSVFVSSNGDDTKGWVLRVDIAGENAQKLVPFIATKVATEVDAPVGIAMSPRGELVVGQMGEITVPNDSLLTFYNAESGEMRVNLPTNLFDISALAYHPRTSKLYALDYAWMQNSEGGLYRLDMRDNGQLDVVKIALPRLLDKPTAMAFAPDGTLYVTVIGSPGTEEPASPDVGTGMLVKITGEL